MHHGLLVNLRQQLNEKLYNAQSWKDLDCVFLAHIFFLLNRISICARKFGENKIYCKQNSQMISQPPLSQCFKVNYFPLEWVEMKHLPTCLSTHCVLLPCTISLKSNEWYRMYAYKACGQTNWVTPIYPPNFVWVGLIKDYLKP